MFKKPFNKEIGEIRECNECSARFHTIRPRWRCNDCINKKQKIVEKAKRAKYLKKDKYPFNNKTNEAGSRFCSIRTALSNAWKEYNRTGDKSYVIEHYNKQLKDIQENGILTWILDRRDDETIKQNKVKNYNITKKDYPDTRGHYEY